MNMPSRMNTNDILDRFFRKFTAGSRPLLLLDYDGTLAPFHLDRFQAVPWSGAREILNEIQSRTKTRIVVITGRPATEIQPLLALDQPVEIWGLHGFEHLHADGRRELESIAPGARKKLDELHSQLHRDSFGALFEAKPNAAVIHWRGLPDDQVSAIEQRSRSLFEPLAHIDGFRLLPFESGLELRIGRDKGGAVSIVLNECDECGPAAYLGDDLTDESAFCAIKNRGLSILVRPEPRETAADLWLNPPGQFLSFLTSWLDAAV